MGVCNMDKATYFVTQMIKEDALEKLTLPYSTTIC